MECPEFDYQSLKAIKGQQMTYGDLLNTLEWFSKRNTIIERDENQCVKCKRYKTFSLGGNHFRELTLEEKMQDEDRVKKSIKTNEAKYGFAIADAASAGIEVEKPIYLHVHHKYYILNKLPWEYQDDVLVTLCHFCHCEVHERDNIKIFKDERRAEEVNMTPCSRCLGRGYISEYRHVQGGICFRCHGFAYDELFGFKN